MILPPQDLSYEDFPDSPLFPEGMRTLTADRTPRDVHVQIGIPYSNRDGVALHLIVITPKGEAESAYPLILYVQGSAWRKQQLGASLPGLMRFAQRGYVIAIAQYRPSSVAPFPAQVLDAKAAARYLCQHAARYGGDPERLILWGDSSGGHTVTMASVTLQEPAFDDGAAEPLRVRACVDYYGPTDLARMNAVPSTMDHMGPASPEGQLLGGVPVLEHPDKVAAACPMTYLAKGAVMPPLLVVHGSKDRLVPFEQSVLLVEIVTTRFDRICINTIKAE